MDGTPRSFVKRALLALLLAGCVGRGSDGAASLEQPIINGTADSHDTSVVALLASDPSSNGGLLCTAEVISPHVLLTAAHCVFGADGFVFQVFPGDSLAMAQAGQFLAVKEVHAHPDYDPSGFGVADVGIVILAEPTTLTPLSYNVTPIPMSYKGKEARIVGYGLTNPKDNTSYGVRQEAPVAISDWSATLINVYDGFHTSCEGDSGGPSFLKVANREVVGGVTSFGFSGCPTTTGSTYSRVDAYHDFIDGFVVANDGPQGAAQVGDPCAINRDCASGICAASPDGTMQFCTATCDPTAKSDSCPKTLPCSSVDDIAVCMTPVKHSGCEIGGGGSGGSAQGAAPLLLLLAAVVWVTSRRARS